jgi:hypothetical protein
MTTQRVPIPKSVERELLFRNQSVCCILTYQPNTTAKIIESLRSFHEIGKWYNRTPLTTAVLEALRKIKKELESGMKDHSNKTVAKSKLRGALTLTEKTLLTLEINHVAR